MPLVKRGAQTGAIGTRRNLNILCDVFLLSTLFMGILLTAPGCCAKIETQIKLLNDDYTVPTRMGSDEVSSSLSADTQQQPTVPHYNLYKDDLKRISYETIHRILRDENEPMVYRANDLRYSHKRSSMSAMRHDISKRSLMEARPPGISLDLSNSNLEKFSQVTNSTHSLADITSINLHNNSLNEFPLEALTSLTILDLSANNFTRFAVASANSQLRVLNLNQNHIVKFTTLTSSNATSGSNNLRELHLKDNSMHWLVQLNLSQLNELEILDLSCNQLENLETAFFPSRMKNLKYLNLARNRLQCIYRETFYNLLSMNTLILSYNEITEIDYETFLALPNLQYLDLSHNRLRGDSIRALQGIPDLVGLSIAYNWQLGDSMQEFVASWSLKELDASGTGLCKIPAALAQSVRTLKLADNWLTIINCGDLDSYPLLQYLDLSHSHINEIEEDALGRLEILETLFLDHNNLKRIPISLPTSLEHLFLHDNQIMDIQSQSFQGLNNLKTLDLSANKLLYLPDLPLPKLLTLNLQSSGINGLHQGIVKTSPHLRDLYLEDNPIKCSDLLGIAEWASPCRNDRRIAERINIKSRYIRMHNYFERFHCESSAHTCARCVGDVPQSETPSQGNTTKVNCAEVNGIGRTAKPTIEGISISNIELLLSQKTSTDSPITKSTTDANQDELQRTSNTPTSSPTTGTAAPPEISTPSTTTIASRILTNSTDKISPPLQQKQLADESPIQDVLPTSPTPTGRLITSQIKSDNNYVETSAGSSSYSTTPPPPSSGVGSLLSQESTGKSQKGLKAQSDKATKIGHGINGEISVATTAAKSNLPRTTFGQQQGQHTEAQNLQTTITKPASTTMRTTTTTMSIWEMPRARGSDEVPKEQQQQQQQHNKLQEILHTKDRHLIGTPLLMHKGHVVLVPGAELLNPTTAATTTTTSATTPPKQNLLLLAPRQNVQASHGNSTTITTSKGHKLEKLLDAYPQQHHHNPSHHHQQQQQQGSNENAIIKGAKKKMTNSPLGQENHYQDIQQTQQQHKVQTLPSSKRIRPQKQQHSQNQAAAPTDTKTSSAQQKSKEQTPTASVMRNDKDHKDNYKNEFDDDTNGGIAPQSTKQFANNFKLGMAHSLNTPLDGPIIPQDMDEMFNSIDESSTAVSTTPAHHARVNTPLLLPQDGDLQNLDINVIPTSFQESPSLNRSNNHEAASPITTATSSADKSIPQQQHTIKSERWLDIRKATRHPGLVVVIGVAFAMVFIVGLVQVYRYRQKPLNYIGHEHYGYQPEHQQYQQHDSQDQQCRRHHHPYHQYRPHSKPQSNNNGNNHNQCNDERMQSTSSPHHLLRIHEKPPLPPAFCYDNGGDDDDIQMEKKQQPSGYATNRSSTTSNYRLFQLNGKRIKHNHNQQRPSEHENDFYTEMNHGPQSVLPSDFFPMELLSAPSKIQTTPSSMLDPDPASSSLAQPPPLHSHSHSHPRPSTGGVSLVGHQQHSNPEQRTIIDEDFQIVAAGRERSKFDIW